MMRPPTEALLFLFAFDLCRLLNVFGGQFAKLLLRFSDADILGVPPAFVGLISQID